MIGLALALLTATPATVEAQIAKAQGGDTVQLAPGAYPRITVYNLKPAVQVTIDASAAQIGTLAFQNASNFALVGGSFGPATYGIVQVTKSDHISLAGGHYSGSGTAAISITGSSYIHVEGNSIRRSGADGIDISASQFVGAVRNSCADFIVTPLHPDCIQAWSITGQPQVTDLDIEDNTASGHMQGFDGFDHGTGGYMRVTVRGNVAAIDASWAGSWNSCKACVVTDNIAYTLPTLPKGIAPPVWFATDAASDGQPDSGKSGNLLANNTNGSAP